MKKENGLLSEIFIQYASSANLICTDIICIAVNLSDTYMFRLAKPVSAKGYHGGSIITVKVNLSIDS